MPAACLVAAAAVCGVAFAAKGCDEAGSGESNATAALCAGASDSESGRRRFHPHVTWAMIGVIVCFAGAGVARVYASRGRDWFYDIHRTPCRPRPAPLEDGGVEMAEPIAEAHAVVVGSAHGQSGDVAVARPIVQGVSLAGSNAGSNGPADDSYSSVRYP